MKRQLKYSVLQYICSTGNLELISTQQMIGTAVASFHACQATHRPFMRNVVKKLKQ